MMKMLTQPNRDFLLWNTRAGDLKTPKIAAIVMTMTGAKSQIEATPDAASRMYIERAIGIAQKHPQLFDMDDPSDAFVITDDFMSSGRISGAKSTPSQNCGSAVFIQFKGDACRSTDLPCDIKMKSVI
jgi:chromosome partitioning protein